MPGRESAQADVADGDARRSRATAPGDVRSAQTWGALPVSGGRPAHEVLGPDLAARLGHDVADVQVHAGHDSDRVAARLGARAFTVGRHVYLGPEVGRGTLAAEHVVEHELGHALGARPGTRPTAGRAPQGATAAEEHAARDGRRLGTAAGTSTGTPGGLVAPTAGATGGEFVGLEPLPTQDVDTPASAPTTSNRPEVAELDFAFVFTGGGYGQAAEQFISRYYPGHRLIRSHSFEAMFDTLYTEMRRVPTDRSAHLRELVVVTHANAAGGMQIPLTRGDVARHRFFTVWDADDLQEEFQEGMHARFRQRRRDVVATMIDDQTRVIVRGCEFGQSDQALDVLRSMVGGQAWVWAPTVYQGYESVQIGASHLATPEEAFDFLMEQDFLPLELRPAPDEEKREYVARVFGLRGHVPTEFFVVGQEDHDRLVEMIHAGTGRSEAGEELKVREPATVPSAGQFWNVSAPPASGTDAELDPLPLREIALRARALNHPYRPEHAGVLQRLRRAWERKVSGMDELVDWLLEDTNDPLDGLPGDSLAFMLFLRRHYRDDPAANPLAGIEPENYFGDSNLLAIDAAQHPSTTPQADTFETEMLAIEPPEDDARTTANEFAEELAEPGPPQPTPVAPPAPTPDEVQRQAALEAEREAERERMRQARDFSKGATPEPEPAPPPLDLSTLSDDAILALYREALVDVDEPLLADVEEELGRRLADPDHPGFGTALPRDLAAGRPANAGVPSDVALEILRSSTEGRFPWRPDLGRVGGVAWFVTEGTPYVGADRGGSVSIPVELVNADTAIVFREAELLEVFERERAALEPVVEAEYRRTAHIDDSTPLNSKQRRYMRGKFLDQAAESRMWQRVGEQVRASQHGVGEVVLENSRFSRSGNGRFAVVRDAAKIRIRGGATTVLAALRNVGEAADPVLAAAAEEAAIRNRWSGRVRGVFRYGGRVLIVIGLANDAYRIVTAEDTTREVLSVAGGWAGATAAGAAFAYWYTPADVAGPWAWLGHGVGTLLAGGIGYFIGSEATTTVYELVIDEEDTAEVPE
ncbi:DUF4157 domain-containing protein [Cellulosimicrobium terreum]|nr:DUF4157 domain-containing protein [Cellulosimicrobium terreum]